MLDLTPARVRQLRSVILAERKEEHTTQVALAERMTRELVAHVRAAAGDKGAAKAAAKVSFLGARKASPGPKQLPSTEAVMQRFGMAPPPGE